jgi:hypothetical protein
MPICPSHFVENRSEPGARAPRGWAEKGAERPRPPRAMRSGPGPRQNPSRRATGSEGDGRGRLNARPTAGSEGDGRARRRDRLNVCVRRRRAPRGQGQRSSVHQRVRSPEACPTRAGPRSSVHQRVRSPEACPTRAGPRSSVHQCVRSPEAGTTMAGPKIQLTHVCVRRRRAPRGQGQRL